MSEENRIDVATTLRLEALRLAVELYSREDLAIYGRDVTREAEVFYKFLIGGSDE